MNKKLISLAIASAVATPFAAQAGSLNVANQDITLSGGLTGAYLYNIDTKRDNFEVNDALLDFTSAAKTGGVGFNLGLGTLGGNSLAPGSALTSIGGGGTAGVQYGWVSVVPTDGLKLDIGKLATNVGYEVVPSYSNDNILRGLVWNLQPTYYNGARATYSTGGINVYAEANKPSATTTGSAVGVSGNFGSVNGAINFFDTVNLASMVDVIVSSKVGSVKVAANLDYVMKAKATKTAGTDDNAIGLALYASMPIGDKSTLPVRLEYINDGTSGLYGLGSAGVKNNAWTFTISPTYNFSNSTFVRAELAYVSTDKKSVYVDDKGAITDTNTIVGVQGGIRF